MAEVAKALASLQLDHQNAAFLLSPSHRQPRHTSATLCPVRLFPEGPSVTDAITGNKAEIVSDANKEAAWNSIIGDLFQAVVEHLPAHTAQHAMLVCRQWHDSVTDGLVYLRPRALRLDCIHSR